MKSPCAPACAPATALRHETVLLHEAVAAVLTRPDGIYVDGTFGRGGHSRLLLSHLAPNGRLFAFDRDPAAIASAQTWNDPRFTLIHAPFSELRAGLSTHGVTQIDGLLLDLGVSSPQLDDPARGFSFRFDAPLDMRMDTTRGITVAQWLASVEENELTQVIRDYGEERFARAIARTIVQQRAQTPITHTHQLAQLIAQQVKTREIGQHPATRTFQALRIWINRELDELDNVLQQGLECLAPHGRLAVISFHSLEDRRVKQFIRAQQNRDTLPSNMPIRAVDLPPPLLQAMGKAQRPSSAEVAANARARSALLRVAERTEAPLLHPFSPK